MTHFELAGRALGDEVRLASFYRHGVL